MKDNGSSSLSSEKAYDVSPSLARALSITFGNKLKLSKQMKKLILPLLSLLLLASTADGRFWTNKDGISFEGELVEVKDNAVTIRRTNDRRKFTMAIGGLSAADQNYLKHLKEQNKPEAKDDFDFFGLKREGNHIAFILDCSGSMGSGDRSQIYRREVIRSLGQLPHGVNVSIIFFNGMAWDIHDDPGKVSKNWVRLIDKNGKASLYMVFPKTEDDLSKAKWIELKNSTRNKLQEKIETSRLFGGTAFDVGFFMAYRLDPMPTTIFFLTDGACSSKRGIDKIKKLVAQAKAMHGHAGMPVLHTIGLDISGGADPKNSSSGKHLLDIAALGKGNTVFVESDNYIKKYGEDTSVDWDRAGRASKDDTPIDFIDVKQDDSRYAKAFKFDHLEKEKMPEAEANKEKPKTSKSKLPQTKEELARWIVGTEWAYSQLTIATDHKGRRSLRFNPEGVVHFQFGVLAWEKNLAFKDSEYRVLSENSILWGSYGWTIVFDKKFKTFKGRTADKKQTCSGKLLGSFQ